MPISSPKLYVYISEKGNKLQVFACSRPTTGRQSSTRQIKPWLLKSRALNIIMCDVFRSVNGRRLFAIILCTKALLMPSHAIKVRKPFYAVTFSSTSNGLFFVRCQCVSGHTCCSLSKHYNCEGYIIFYKWVFGSFIMTQEYSFDWKSLRHIDVLSRGRSKQIEHLIGTLFKTKCKPAIAFKNKLRSQ